jgi:hypothetical protein
MFETKKYTSAALPNWTLTVCNGEGTLMNSRQSAGFSFTADMPVVEIAEQVKSILRGNTNINSEADIAAAGDVVMQINWGLLLSGQVLSAPEAASVAVAAPASDDKDSLVNQIMGLVNKLAGK